MFRRLRLADTQRTEAARGQPQLMPATWEHDRSVQQRAAACLLKLRCDCELRLLRGPTAAAAPALSVGGRGPVFRAQGRRAPQ